MKQITGRVISAYNSFFYVMPLNGDSELTTKSISCKLRGKLKRDRRDTLVVVGDIVKVELISDSEGIIDEVLPRENLLYRPQVANISQVLLTFAIKEPDIHALVLNRFLVAAEWSKIPKILICLNKMDLANHGIRESLGYYQQIGYPVYYVSTVIGEGIDTLSKDLANEVTVLAGPSGVGKSSLLNAMDSRLKLQTGTVSEKIKRGRHTTRRAELIPYRGGFVVDTPGFSQLDMVGIKVSELAYLFKDFLPLAGKCRFAMCSHSHEPDCIIKGAVASGNISEERYQAYLTILQELKER